MNLWLVIVSLIGSLGCGVMAHPEVRRQASTDVVTLSNGRSVPFAICTLLDSCYVLLASNTFHAALTDGTYSMGCNVGHHSLSPMASSLESYPLAHLTETRRGYLISLTRTTIYDCGALAGYVPCSNGAHSQFPPASDIAGCWALIANLYSQGDASATPSPAPAPGMLSTVFWSVDWCCKNGLGTGYHAVQWARHG
jgi:hypothetical protein